MPQGSRGRAVCLIDECGKPAKGYHMCVGHYHAWWLQKAPPDEPLTWPSELHVRYWNSVDKDGPISTYRPDLDQCWIWTSTLTDDGYGIMRLPSNRKRGTHVIGFRLAGSSIPLGCEIDHLCKTRACCNPTHLEAVPHAVNVRRGGNAVKTHCIHGHEFTPENTRISKRGGRVCRECNIITCREWHERRIAHVSDPNASGDPVPVPA